MPYIKIPVNAKSVFSSEYSLAQPYMGWSGLAGRDYSEHRDNRCGPEMYLDPFLLCKYLEGRP